MSNQEKLQDAMNFLDEKIIAEAEPEAKVISVKKRFPWKAVVGIAATLVIVAGATIAFTITRSNKTAEMDGSGNSYTPKGKEQGEILQEAAPSEQKSETQPDETLKEMETKSETYALPQWDEQEDWERYGAATLNGKEYCASGCSNNEEYIEKELPEQAILTGWDWYKDEIHERNAKAYAISGISTDLAISVRFEEAGATYVYFDNSYEPKTLGELMAAVNLEEDLEVGLLYREVEIDGTWKLITYDGVTAETVKTMLLFDKTLANETGAEDPSRRAISISVMLPRLGNRFYSVWLTEGGYLGTNILETEKRFFIGEDRVAEFVNYVIDTFPGCEYEYDSQSGGEITIE